MTQKGILGEQQLGGGLLGQNEDSQTQFNFNTLEPNTSTSVTAIVGADLTNFNFNTLKANTSTQSTAVVVTEDNPRFEFKTILPIRRASRIIQFDLDQVGVWDGGELRWDASTGSNTDVLVEVSKDNRNWTEITSSGDSINIYSKGDIVLGESLYVSLTLVSNNDVDTPSFDDFKVDVTPR